MAEWGEWLRKNISLESVFSKEKEKRKCIEKRMLLGGIFGWGGLIGLGIGNYIAQDETLAGLFIGGVIGMVIGNFSCRIKFRK
jgi:hypothetical protein